MNLIQPRTLKGFRDLMPERALRRARLVRKVEDVFRAHGYGPIDSPVLEYAEIIKGKGGGETDKEIFEFTDKGGRQVALRNDLTIPLARYVAQHQGQLIFPFRRYHVGLVFRGERPQRGRAREFLQCDADIVGPVSVAADAESLIVMASVYEALGVGAVTLRVNDRRILNGLLDLLDARELAVPVLRALDKREKHGEETVRREMAEAGLKPEAIDRILAFSTAGANDAATLDAMEAAVQENAEALSAVAELRQVLALFSASGQRKEAIQVDPSIARGLDYYTGIVMEAQLDALPGIGSVGAGGRYDDLAGLYTKANLPGVGFTIGITRLIDALEALEQEDGQRCPTQAMVTHGASETLPGAFAFVAALRALGIASEVYPEAKKHGQQMRYADRRGIPFVFTPNEDGSLHGKRLSDGEICTCADAAAAADWIRSA